MIQNRFQEQLECCFTNLESGPIPIWKFYRVLHEFSAPSQDSLISLMAQTFFRFLWLETVSKPKPIGSPLYVMDRDNVLRTEQTAQGGSDGRN